MSFLVFIYTQRKVLSPNYFIIYPYFCFYSYSDSYSISQLVAKKLNKYKLQKGVETTDTT